MRLRRVSIRNFKSIPPRGVDVTFRNRLVVLVGKNNAGKSNILEALSLLFGAKNPRYIRLGPESYNDPSQQMVIEAEFQGLTWAHGKKLGLSDRQCGSLMHSGKRVATSPGCMTFRLTCPPVEPEATDEESEEDVLGRQTFQVFLANRYEVKKNEDLRKATVAHLLIPAVRSHGDLLSPSTWTVYGRFLRDVLAGSDHAEKLAALITEATEQLRELLADEASELTKTAKATAYVDEISFRLTREGNPLELLRNLSLSVTYAGRTEDISQVGTGTQSAVIIGVLELCLRHRARRGLRLFSVEEPELFLHPHAQRYVASLLRAIADEQDSQVILTTHSGAVLLDTDILDVIRVDRDEHGCTRCLRLSADYEHLEITERILTPATCEMLFADRVVLVEGPSEAILLPRLSRAIAERENERRYSYDYNNISVIDVAGKDNLRTYSAILTTFGIDWCVVTDRDALRGGALSPYKEAAGLAGTEPDADQIRRLRQHGVAVLSRGEIEDYYPHEALAELAGCDASEVAQKIEASRVVLDEPSVFEIVSSIVQESGEELLRAPAHRFDKLLKKAYDRAISQVRTEKSTPSQKRAKTGDAVARWLKLPKPLLAHKVAEWFQNNPERIPEPLVRLVEWTLGASLRKWTNARSGHLGLQPRPQ